MVIGFKERFVQPILDGTKIHTLRDCAPDRWKAGRSIQFATGVRTKSYKQFKEGVCTGVDTVWIEPDFKFICLIQSGGNPLPIYDHDLFARNDGFASVEDFWNWPWGDKVYQLIHWTDFRY
jgi:hypothetical protein